MIATGSKLWRDASHHASLSIRHNLLPISEKAKCFQVDYAV
jgi:hypothetical protein